MGRSHSSKSHGYISQTHSWPLHFWDLVELWYFVILHWSGPFSPKLRNYLDKGRGYIYISRSKLRWTFLRFVAPKIWYLISRSTQSGRTFICLVSKKKYFLKKYVNLWEIIAIRLDIGRPCFSASSSWAPASLGASSTARTPSWARWFDLSWTFGPFIFVMDYLLEWCTKARNRFDAKLLKFCDRGKGRGESADAPGGEVVWRGIDRFKNIWRVWICETVFVGDFYKEKHITW